MKKYTLMEPNRIEVQELPIPKPGKGEVLIRVKYVGVCGSDVHLFNGSYNGPFSYPMLFGHEWSGIVETAGEGVTAFAPGDMVTGDCSKYCGHCDNCQTNKNLCRNIEKFGITIDGASAEYIVRDARYVYHAPEGSDLKLLSLTEPVAVAAAMITKIKRAMPDIAKRKVLIFGGGPIGAAALMLLKLAEGCEHVDLFDIAKSRCDTARQLGADIPEAESLDVKPGSDYASLYAAAKYDAIIETTGNAKVFASTLYLTKPAGVIGCVGMIAKAEIEQKLIVTKSLCIIGSIGGTGEFEAVMDFLSAHKETASKLISHTMPMENAAEAFKLSRNAEGTMKIVLQV